MKGIATGTVHHSPCSKLLKIQNSQDRGCKKQPNASDLQVSGRFRQITSKWLRLAPGELELLTASTLKDPVKIRSTSRIEVVLCLLVYPFPFPSTQACNKRKYVWIVLSCCLCIRGNHTSCNTRNKFLSHRKVNKRLREVLSSLLNSILKAYYDFLLIPHCIETAKTRETETNARVLSECGWAE